MARENNVSILKMPSHVTDRLQPLDVGCFSPLKKNWDKRLISTQRERNFRTFNKAELVDLLCSVWYASLTPSNIKAGFQKSGIFPVNRGTYPTSVFDSLKLASYNAKAVESGAQAVESGAQAVESGAQQPVESGGSTAHLVNVSQPSHSQLVPVLVSPSSTAASSSGPSTTLEEVK